MLSGAVCQGTVWTPSKVIDRLGRVIDNPDSVYYWAHKVCNEAYVCFYSCLCRCLSLCVRALLTSLVFACLLHVCVYGFARVTSRSRCLRCVRALCLWV